jgi:hypothetical protein
MPCENEGVHQIQRDINSIYLSQKLKFMGQMTQRESRRSQNSHMIAVPGYQGAKNKENREK